MTISDKANGTVSSGFDAGLIQASILSLGSMTGILSWFLESSAVGALVRTTNTG